MKADKAAQAAAKARAEKARADRERKQDKKDREKETQRRMKEAKTKVDTRGAYGAGIAKGGLLSKQKAKPKQMRSGGLASKN